MSLYPFRLVQKLRIFGNGEKIRNVQNIPMILLNQSSQNLEIPHSRVTSKRSFTGYCSFTNTRRHWLKLAKHYSSMQQSWILDEATLYCGVSARYPKINPVRNLLTQHTWNINNVNSLLKYQIKLYTWRHCTTESYYMSVNSYYMSVMSCYMPVISCYMPVISCFIPGCHVIYL